MRVDEFEMLSGERKRTEDASGVRAQACAKTLYSVPTFSNRQPFRERRGS